MKRKQRGVLTRVQGHMMLAPRESKSESWETRIICPKAELYTEGGESKARVTRPNVYNTLSSNCSNNNNNLYFK